MRKTVLMSVLACAAAIGVAGCSGAPSSSNPAPVTLDPLDVGAYVDKPCTLMGADQLSEYGVTKPGVVEDKMCAWTPDDPARPSFKAGAEVDTRTPTSSSPVKVNGFPAENLPDGTTGCTVRVAVAPDQQITVSLTGQNACHTADLVATLVLATIKRLSP